MQYTYMDNLAVLTLISIGFIIAGLWLRFLTPGINKFYGYRTKTSMASQENWDFSQKYSGGLFAALGIILLLIAVAIEFSEINIDNNGGKATVVVLMLCSIIAIIVMTEKAMKKHLKK